MVDPQGLEQVLKYIREKYGNIGIYIHENGNPSSLRRHLELQEVQKQTISHII